MEDSPKFNFEVPKGYRWLIERGLIGFETNGPLQPWHYVTHAFELREMWPSSPSKQRLVAFARRQDCDDIACFEVEEGRVNRVVVVHGWTNTGYEIQSVFEGFWAWLKFVVDEIADWVEHN